MFVLSPVSFVILSFTRRYGLLLPPSSRSCTGLLPHIKFFYSSFQQKNAFILDLLFSDFFLLFASLQSTLFQNLGRVVWAWWCLGVKMTGVAKCLGCKMSGCQNIWVSKCLDLYAVAQCLGGTLSGWHNVWVAKCLVVKMSGCQKVGCKNFRVSK